MRVLRSSSLKLLIPAILAATAPGCTSDDAEPNFGDAPYVVISSILADDTSTGVVFFLDSIEKRRSVDAGEALEVPNGTLLPIEGARAFLHLSFEGPFATRYDLTEDGTLVEGATVSAANLGGSFLSEIAVTGPEAVWVASNFSGMGMARINPQTMAITAEIRVEELFDPDYPESGFHPGVVRDGMVYVPTYRNNDTQGTGLPATALVVLDPDTLDYAILEDDRCPSGRAVIIGDDIIVGATDAFGAGHRIAGSEGYTEPCALRIPSGSNTFDPFWVRDFSTWTGDDVSAELIPVREDLAYIRVFDDALKPTDAAFYWEYTYSDAWRWATIDPFSEAPAVRIDSPPSFGRVEIYSVDGVPWTFDYVESEGRSTLRSLRDDGIGTGVTVPGFVRYAARLGA